MCHSIRDTELICQVVTKAGPWKEDPGVVQKAWTSRPDISTRLSIGVMEFDGVVMPHPPILNGLREAVEKLKSAGYEVVTFKPYQHQRAWDIAVGYAHLFVSQANAFAQYPLYYATGGKEMQALLDATGEPWPPAAAKLSANPELRELSARELYHVCCSDLIGESVLTREW
jgi:amidase